MMLVRVHPGNNQPSHLEVVRQSTVLFILVITSMRYLTCGLDSFFMSEACDLFFIVSGCEISLGMLL